MKIPGYLIIGMLLLIVAAVAGCTTTPAAPAPATTAVSAPQPSPNAVTTSTLRTETAAGVNTIIIVPFNDLQCNSAQDLLGTMYLYPDQKFRLEAAPPENKAINPNVLFVDENDQLKLRQAKPKWDNVQKTWVYDGPVPLVQFNDITAPVKREFTIKSQSKYYICVDDRKESGTSDIVYRVPVTLTRL